MGMIDKLKGISNWQTVTTICFYISAVTTVTGIAIYYNITWLIAAGATTLGIVAGSLTSGIKSIPVPTENPTNKQIETIENKRLEHIEHNIATLACEFANLKSQFEIVKINKEIDSIE